MPLNIMNSAMRVQMLGLCLSLFLLLTMLIFKSSSAWVFYEDEVKTEKRRGKRNENTRKYKIIMYSILVLFSLYFLFLYMGIDYCIEIGNGSISLSTKRIIQDVPLFNNFMDAWNSQPFGTYFKNSMIVTVVNDHRSINLLFTYGIWVCKVRF